MRIRTMEYTALIHEEDGSYWAEVKELPGCFASGADLDELKDAVIEAITLYLQKDGDEGNAVVAGHVDEMRVLLPI